MASVTDHLNDLLVRERGEVEAVRELVKEIACTDPDIADSAKDAFDTARWSCQGLYHRIVRLGGTATLEAEPLAGRLSELPDTKSKIELVCAEQDGDATMIADLLAHPGLDRDTQTFLDELLRAHHETKQWCVGVLSQWRVER
jgi:hypothetical protein